VSLRPGELLIHDDTPEAVHSPGTHAKGLVPRDFAADPQGSYASAPAFDLPLIPRAEWPARIADKEATQSRLSDIRLTGNNGAMIPALDQNGKGYCWAHSSTGGVMIVRAAANLPYVPLSAYAVACVIKNFQDEGGWGALSLDFITTRGVPSSQFWPMQSMSRANDNPATWANAALHKAVESWVDLTAAAYDRTLSFDQEITLLLSGTPVVTDLNWWSHSVLSLDAVNGTAQRTVTRADSGKLASVDEFEAVWGINDPVTGGFGKRILNSWGDSWSDRGMGVLTGTKAVSDGAVAPRAVTTSMG
jgi:hypothetical protein